MSRLGLRQRVARLPANLRDLAVGLGQQLREEELAAAFRKGVDTGRSETRRQVDQVRYEERARAVRFVLVARDGLDPTHRPLLTLLPQLSVAQLHMALMLLAGGTDVETTVQRLHASVDCRSDASGGGPW